jgi:hypothetical protein
VTPITSTFFFVTSFTSLHFAGGSKYFMYIYHIYYYKLCELVCAAQFLVNFSFVCYTQHAEDQFSPFKIWSCQFFNQASCQGRRVNNLPYTRTNKVCEETNICSCEASWSCSLVSWTIKGTGWRRTLKLQNIRVSDALFGSL